MNEKPGSSTPSISSGSTAPPLPIGAILLAGLAMGAGGDFFLRASDEPGLNFFLLYLGLALAVVLVSRKAGLTLSREAWILLGAGVVLAVGMVLRGAPALRLLSFFAAATAFALPALRSGGAWLRGSGVSDQIEAIAAAGLHSAFGSIRLAVDDSWRTGAAGSPDNWRRAGLVLRGALLATPLLILFGALFISADPLFADIVADLVRIDLEAFASHIVIVGVLAWLACGYFVGFVGGTRLTSLRRASLPRPSIGIIEAGTALGLVDLLFLAFVVVQFRYLFGGSDFVEVTPGLTYSEYAREGFAQLAVASAFVLPSLLAADWLLRREGPGDERTFRGLGGLQLLLLLAIIGSALQRVRVYQTAYGLTEARLYGAVFLVWLVALTLWFAATVLRGRRERFAFPSLLSALVVVVGLHLASPDAVIVRANLDRAGVAAAAGTPGDQTGAPGDRVGADVDLAYLGSLSADAVPALVGSLPALPPSARCSVAEQLLARWGPDRTSEWKSWNWSVARARRLVRAEDSGLRSMAPVGGCP